MKAPNRWTLGGGIDSLADLNLLLMQGYNEMAYCDHAKREVE